MIIFPMFIPWRINKESSEDKFKLLMGESISKIHQRMNEEETLLKKEFPDWDFRFLPYPRCGWEARPKRLLPTEYHGVVDHPLFIDEVRKFLPILEKQIELRI